MSRSQAWEEGFDDVDDDFQKGNLDLVAECAGCLAIEGVYESADAEQRMWSSGYLAGYLNLLWCMPELTDLRESVENIEGA